MPYLKKTKRLHTITSLNKTKYYILQASEVDASYTGCAISENREQDVIYSIKQYEYRYLYFKQRKDWGLWVGIKKQDYDYTIIKFDKKGREICP